MPYRRRRRTKRKTTRRTRRPRARMQRPLPLVLPNHYKCRLRFASEFSLDAAAGAIAYQSVRANDLKDPIVGSDDHQPMGFDQLCTIFKTFTVLGSKITIRAVDSAAGTLVPAYWGIMLTANGTTCSSMSTITQLLEQEHATRPRISFGAYAGNSLINGRNSVCSKTFSLRKFFNMKDTDGSDYQCTNTASAATLAYFEVWAASAAGQNSSSLNYLLTIDYIVRCNEPIALVQS